MDLYAEDLTDYIYQENDVDKKRALLLEVEAEIKKLMGKQEKGSLDLRHIGATQIEKIQDLVNTRSLILSTGCFKPLRRKSNALKRLMNCWIV